MDVLEETLSREENVYDGGSDGGKAVETGKGSSQRQEESGIDEYKVFNEFLTFRTGFDCLWYGLISNRSHVERAEMRF